MNYVLGFGLIALALLLFIMAANNSWMNMWDALKQKEGASADTGAPQPSTPGPNAGAF